MHTPKNPNWKFFITPEPLELLRWKFAPVTKTSLGTFRSKPHPLWILCKHKWTSLKRGQTLETIFWHLKTILKFLKLETCCDLETVSLTKEDDWCHFSFLIMPSNWSLIYKLHTNHVTMLMMSWVPIPNCCDLETF